MSKPRLLDLFCGGGGAAMGYYRAGFDVVGVDIQPQPHYPFEFHQADAMTFSLDGYDCIHASPPCQGYSRMRHLPWLKDRVWPLLIDPLRERFADVTPPWIIENVEDAPLQGITLCGVMFGLKVYRHRKFESNYYLMQPGHLAHEHIIVPGRWFSGNHPVIPAHGFVSALGKVPLASATAAVGIDWMTRDELSQSIPPAYTEYIGRQLVAVLSREEHTMTIDRHLRHPMRTPAEPGYHEHKAASRQRGTEASARVRHAAAERRRQEKADRALLEEQERAEG